MENNNGKFFGVLTRSALIVRTERAAVRFCAALTPAGLALIGEERQSVERQMAQLGPADVWVDDGEECGDEVALHDRWLAQYVRVTIARRTDWEYDGGEVSVQEAKVARQVEAADPLDVEARAWTLGVAAASPPTAPRDDSASAPAPALAAASQSPSGDALAEPVEAPRGILGQIADARMWGRWPS